MVRLFFIVIFWLLACLPAGASVEIALGGSNPATIEEVYRREGTSFLSVDEVLRAVGLSGRWISVDHVYTFNTPRGTAIISPGSQFIRLNGDFIPLSHRPRFIDGKLRVPENFVTGNLRNLLGQPVYYRNLQPVVDEETSGEEGTLDRLFAFLLSKKKTVSIPGIRGVAIDPGHGGEDQGVIGLDGVKEKDVTLNAARRFEKLIKMRMGIPVYLSRDGDYALTWQKRFEPALRSDVDALITLHAQGAFSSGPQGLALFIRPQNGLENEQTEAVRPDLSLQLAQELKVSLEKQGLPVLDIIQAPLLPLGRGDLPSVLVEMGYLTNSKDKRQLVEGAGLDRMAEALYAGFKAFADKQKESMN
ncbi:N-acetylmuramoyl-L-alanine amidase [Desulfuromonas sp. AOP6]|uniref:N-acetylmuramoyl-L-alanine amidase family protein n=1 Tax=Desulfuromonas sp. AOP6 TaxID=1566351 RepID=UPI001279B961|nr:N-acetylmuramoyl-L-alanine amidase [Desulfuromonas sp. AOP6]BCA79891.1 hypothetical protein AOP6_1678 [Desulfuromonas sp. AOP6]